MGAINQNNTFLVCQLGVVVFYISCNIHLCPFHGCVPYEIRPCSTTKCYPFNFTPASAVYPNPFKLEYLFCDFRQLGKATSLYVPDSTVAMGLAFVQQRINVQGYLLIWVAGPYPIQGILEILFPDNCLNP